MGVVVVGDFLQEKDKDISMARRRSGLVWSVAAVGVSALAFSTARQLGHRASELNRNNRPPWNST